MFISTISHQWTHKNIKRHTCYPFTNVLHGYFTGNKSSHKTHNASVPYHTMHHLVKEVCTWATGLLGIASETLLQNMSHNTPQQQFHLRYWFHPHPTSLRLWQSDIVPVPVKWPWKIRNCVEHLQGLISHVYSERNFLREARPKQGRVFFSISTPMRAIMHYMAVWNQFTIKRDSVRPPIAMKEWYHC